MRVQGSESRIRKQDQKAGSVWTLYPVPAFVPTSTGGEVANALVCKTSIHGFKSHSVLHNFNNLLDFP
jgi:hypothetical protein